MSTTGDEVFTHAVFTGRVDLVQVDHRSTLIASALCEVAAAICNAADELGNGGAATPMGAIEAFSVKFDEVGSSIASAISELASRG